MSEMNLEALVAPVSKEKFLTEYWGKNFLHVQRERSPFESLMTFEDVDRLITTGNHSPIRVVKNKVVVPEELYSKGKDTLSIVEYYRQGASIIFDRLDTNWEPLKNLAFQVFHELQTARDIFSNVYLTPASSQAFKLHCDWQDVFVLQLEGEKVWNLYSPAEVDPLNDKQCKNFAKNVNETHKIAELTLKKGDTLYVPRGMPHEVKTANKLSLHITFTIIPLTYFDIFQIVLSKLADAERPLRRQVDRQFFTHPKEVLSDLITEIGSRVNVGQLLKGLSEEFANNSNYSNLKGYFINLETIKNGADDLTFQLRKNFVSSISRINDETYQVKTKHNEFEINLANEEIDYILTAGKFKVTELPGSLAESNKKQLVESLLAAGILTVTE